MKLIHGDCSDILKNIDNNSINLTLTDIPYNEVNRKSNGLRNLDKGVADNSPVHISALVEELIRVTSGSIYIFCGIEQVSDLRKYLVIGGLSTRLCIWEKTNPSPMNGKKIWLSGIECCVYGKKSNATFNEHCKNTVWRFPTVRGKLHPTMKPVRLMQYLIETSSNIGDIILDPFMGSGTTGIACLNSGRNFIGIEKDETYFNIAKERIYEWTPSTINQQS